VPALAWQANTQIQELKNTKKFKPNPSHRSIIHTYTTAQMQLTKIIIHTPHIHKSQPSWISPPLDLTDCCAPPSDSATTPHHPAVDRRERQEESEGGAMAGSGREQCREGRGWPEPRGKGNGARMRVQWQKGWGNRRGDTVVRVFMKRPLNRPASKRAVLTSALQAKVKPKHGTPQQTTPCLMLPV